MSIVTFWSNGKEETGKTMTIAAISTYMAIEHNYKILVISTNDKSDALKNCFWKEENKNTFLGLFDNSSKNVDIQTGMDGLVRVVRSNKVTPNIITNYTKTVFKDRLEILLSNSEETEDRSNYYPEIINLANKYYDLVFVDLDSNIKEEVKRIILRDSDLIVVNLSQRLRSINIFNNARKRGEFLDFRKMLILIGRYDKFSKYNSKNVSRYLKEKNQILTIPYSTLFFEAAEEAGVPDLFLKLKKVDSDDRNGFFIEEVKRAAENIIYRLQDLQMNM